MDNAARAVHNRQLAKPIVHDDGRLRRWLIEREEARQPPVGHYLSFDTAEVQHQRWQDATASTARHLAAAMATERRMARARAEQDLGAAQRVLARLGP